MFLTRFRKTQNLDDCFQIILRKYSTSSKLLYSTFLYSILSWSIPSFFSCSCSHLTLFPLHKHAEFYNVTFFLSLYTSPAQKYCSKDLFITVLQTVIWTASFVMWIMSLVQDGVPACNKSCQAVLIRSFQLQTAQTVLDTVTLGQHTVNIPLIPAGCGTAVWIPPACSRIFPVLRFSACPLGQTSRQGLTGYMSSVSLWGLCC